MEQILSVLEKTRLLSGMPRAAIEEWIWPQGQVQEYSRDQLLLAPGQTADRLGIVIDGRVQILHLFENGAQSLMSVIAPGQAVGADLVCTQSRVSPYHAAAASAARVFWLNADALMLPGALPEEMRQECMLRLLRLIANENMKKEYRLAILSQNGLRERIWTYLTMQARRRQTRTFEIPFSREEMASFLCVNRSALSHELSRMQREGMISFRKNSFTLHRWEPGRAAEDFG